MKRRALVALAFVFLASGLGATPRAPRQQPAPAGWGSATRVFVGWVNISEEDWPVLGYASRQDWAEAIEVGNLAFQRQLQRKVPERVVTGAKSGKDGSAKDLDLQVKFEDVKFDTDSYRVYLSIHFIDPRTGAELASLPRQQYRGGHFSVSNCMQGALERVAEKIVQEMRRHAARN
jgi:hypothetical protein